MTDNNKTRIRQWAHDALVIILIATLVALINRWLGVKVDMPSLPTIVVDVHVDDDGKYRANQHQIEKK